MNKASFTTCCIVCLFVQSPDLRLRDPKWPNYPIWPHRPTHAWQVTVQHPQYMNPRSLSVEWGAFCRRLLARGDALEIHVLLFRNCYSTYPALSAHVFLGLILIRKAFIRKACFIRHVSYQRYVTSPIACRSLIVAWCMIIPILRQLSNIFTGMSRQLSWYYRSHLNGED